MAGGRDLAIFLCSFIVVFNFLPRGYTQTQIGTRSGAMYTVYDNDMDWTDSGAACTGESGSLAVFHNEEDYRALIDGLRANAAAGDEFWIGYHKPIDSSNARTVGGRIPTFSNFWATGANYSTEFCVKLRLTGNLSESFMYYSRWIIEDCSTTLDRICMSTVDDTCTAVEDACAGTGFTRNLADYCVWSGPSVPLTSDQADEHCAKLGGEVISIYGESELIWLTNGGFFNDLQPWNGYYTGYAQRSGTGAPRYKNGYVQSNGLGDRWKAPTAATPDVFFNNGQGDEVFFASSLSEAGTSLIYYPYFGTWNMYEDAPWDIINVLLLNTFDGGYREPRTAFTICESHKENFCHFNTPEVNNANKTAVNVGHITYTCWENYTFPDGETSKLFSCGCDANELKNVNDMLKTGCLPEEPCTPNVCDHICVPSNRNPLSYMCVCRAGYQLGADGVTCEDINECEENPNICGMGTGSVCQNHEGTFECFCLSGYGYGRSGQCEASSPFTSGTIQIIFGLPSSCGELNDEENRNALIASVYQIAANPIFNSKVTVRDVQISSINQMTITLDIGGVVTFKEQSLISDQFYSILRSLGLTMKDSTACTIPDDIYYYTDGIAQQIRVRDRCSLYNGLNYCSGSQCVEGIDGPVCLCNPGFTGVRCELRLPETTTEPPPPPPEGLSTFELAVIAVLVSFGIILLFNILILCILCANNRPQVPLPIPEPVYGPKPPGPFPRPAPRFGPGIVKRGFPIGKRF